MARVIQISFDELSQELFDWVVKQNKKPLSWLGREAFECFYQVQSHAAAVDLSWQEWLATVSQPCFCCQANNGCWPGCRCNVNVQPESEE